MCVASEVVVVDSHAAYSHECVVLTPMLLTYYFYVPEQTKL